MFQGQCFSSLLRQLILAIKNIHYIAELVRDEKDNSHWLLYWGPFLERPGNLKGPVSYFEIKVSRKLGCVLASNEVYFVFLAENFTV